MKAPASLSAIAISLALGLAQAGGAEWLDARDLRASGSKFETTAAATDGSKEITVADVGDFQAAGRDGVEVQHPLHAVPAWGTGSLSTKPLDGSVEVRG